MSMLISIDLFQVLSPEAGLWCICDVHPKLLTHMLYGVTFFCSLDVPKLSVSKFQIMIKSFNDVSPESIVL